MSIESSRERRRRRRRQRGRIERKQSSSSSLIFFFFFIFSASSSFVCLFSLFAPAETKVGPRSTTTTRRDGGRGWRGRGGRWHLGQRLLAMQGSAQGFTERTWRRGLSGSLSFTTGDASKGSTGIMVLRTVSAQRAGQAHTPSGAARARVRAQNLQLTRPLSSARTQSQHVPMLRFELREEEARGFASGGSHARERAIKPR